MANTLKLTNSLKLNAAIVLSGLTIPEVAEKIGVSDDTLFKKMHNKTEFKASEMNALIEILNISITNINDIFFKLDKECKPVDNSRKEFNYGHS